MTLEEFKKKYKPKNKSKLFDFKSEVIELLADGYSQKSICEYLQDNGVSISQSSISRFVNKILKESIEEPKTEIVKVSPKGIERRFIWKIKKAKK